MGWRVLKRPPRRAIPTTAGLVTLGGAVLVGAAAITASNNLLLILSASALAIIVVSGIASERNLNPVELRLSLLTPAYSGETAQIGASLRATEARSLFGLSLRELAPGSLWQQLWRWRPWRRRKAQAASRFALHFAGVGSQPVTAYAPRLFEGRGLTRVQSLELSTRYPFGLLVKSRDLSESLEVWVRPKRVPLPALLGGVSGRAEAEGQARQGLAGLEVEGLREWRDGDPPQRIHALRSLSLGQELVILTQKESQRSRWVGVLNHPDSDPEALERALELASALMLAWQAVGDAPALCLLGEALDGHAFGVDELLDRLARVVPSEGAILEPNALWLIPEGAPRLGLSRGYRVHANGQLDLEGESEASARGAA